MRQILVACRTLAPGFVVLALLAVAVWPHAPALRARVGAMLTPSDEIIAITIPAINVNSRVVEVRQTTRLGRIEWEVADYAAGHHWDSGAPGEDTNIVLSGHNNINGAVFRRLDELEPGDEIALETEDGGAHRYKVSRIRIVLQDGASERQQKRNARFMNSTTRERLTLISCWPYKPWPPYRIIVFADPI